MFTLSVIDRDRNKLDILSTRSQVELDKFTTCFEDSDALIKKIGLDPMNYEVMVEKNTSSKKKNESIHFTSSRYRNVIYLYQNPINEDKFITMVATEEYDKIEEYFLNELLRFDDDNLNNYDQDRYNKLSQIIYYYDTEEYVVDKNKNKLRGLMKAYFFKNYDYIKSSYTYLSGTGKEFGSTYEKGVLEEVNKKIEEIKNKIDKVKDPLEDKFINGKLSKIKDNQEFINDKEEKVFSFYKPNSDDEDINHEDFEIFMDDYKVEDSRKAELRKKMF